MMTTGSENALVDLPLDPAEIADFPLPSAPGALAPDAPSERVRPAGLGPRSVALAADAATILLVWAAAVLAALFLRGELPKVEGLVWSAGFALLLSFFATVPALILFGKTVGMAVAGLVVRAGETGRRLTSGEATRRWLGTFATAATLGLALLATAWSADSPTLADRLSGRTLVEED